MVRNLLKDKRAVLFLSFLALFSLIMLASVVRDVSFRPARHFSQAESEVVRIPIGQIVASIRNIADIPLEKQIAFLILLLLFVALFVSLLSPEMRKRLLRQFFRLIASVLLIYYLLKLKPDLLAGLFPDLALGFEQPNPLDEGIPQPTFQPPQISGWLSFFITLGIVLLSAIFIWRISRWWVLRKETSHAPHPLDEIAEVARDSLRELSSGQGSAQDKIIQCYADMSRVVVARRGLHREYAMTASEFAARLEKAGLPREPVNRLTHLFESVRYGVRTSAQAEVDEAVACLTSILKYCGESK
jgi:hypothetical protein